MATRLPYTVTTATGEKLTFEFPLHPQTQSAMRTGQLLDAVLATLDRELRVLGDSANGDVLQALAMAIAVRTAMLHAAYDTGRNLSATLTETALDAAESCARDPGMVGNA
jgi:hexokinase